jgi:type 1 glutamine amidotransferase
MNFTKMAIGTTETSKFLLLSKRYIMKHLIVLFLFLITEASGQHLYQLPKQPKAKKELDKIIGKVSTYPLKEKLSILWVYGYDEHHIAGAHDYVKVKNLMVGLLNEVQNVSVDEVFHFPTKEQFEKTDLVVMYLHLPNLKSKQFESFQNYIKNGGGVVSLHETAIMRPASKGKLLSKCLGFAWNEGTSKWGAVFDKINIDNEHEIFKGFPSKIAINDEFYWDLFQEKGTDIIGSVRTGPDEDSDGPIPEEMLSENKSPMFWTYELGKGKVFGTTTGHHTFTYYDPEFRIILFRAMAWVTGIESDPFMSLVFEGITDANNMIGITDPMRYWKGKIRK